MQKHATQPHSYKYEIITGALPRTGESSIVAVYGVDGFITS